MIKIKTPIKTLSASSVSPGKPICGSNVSLSKKHISTFNFHPSKPVFDSSVRASKPIRPSNIRPSKTVSASNICSGKPVCTNHVRPSRSICGSKVCQSNPTSNSNIHHKPIRPNYICFINSSVSTQQISFIFLLSLLAFSVYYKYSISKMKIIINLFLVIIILLTKLTCFRKFFIWYIIRSSIFLRSTNLALYCLKNQKFLFSLKVYIFCHFRYNSPQRP